MQTREIAVVAPSLTITLLDLADIDVDIYVRHIKAMKPARLLFVDNEVAYVGMFDSDTVAKAKRKLQRLKKKESTNV